METSAFLQGDLSSAAWNGITRYKRAMESAMKPILTSAVLGLTLGVPATGAMAQERVLRREQLPHAVATTIDRETQGATIKTFTTEKEHGMTVFEAETVVNGHGRDLQIAADGTLMEVEEEVALDSLPGKIQGALQTKAAGARITKVEALSRRGKLVAYEATTVKGGKKGELQVPSNL